MRSLHGATHRAWISMLSLAFLSFNLIKAQHLNDPQQWENSDGIELRLQAAPDPVQSGMPADLVVILFISEQDPLNTFAGRISFVLDQIEYNKTIVDKRAYMTRTKIDSLEIEENECLPQNEVSFDTVVNAFSSLKLVDGSPEIIDGRAHTKKRIQITIANIPYLVSSSRNVVSVDPIGTTLASKIAFLRAFGDAVKSRDILKPPGEMSITDCFPIPNRSLAYVDPNVEQEIVQFDDKDGCQCPENRLPCLFVHGFGVREDSNSRDTFHYWKNTAVRDHCCSEIHFVHFEFWLLPWHDEKLAKRYCDAARELVSTPDDKTIDDIVIVAHSAGNLVVARAENLGLCKLGPNVKWIALAAPMRGSTLADLAVSIGSGNARSVRKTIAGIFKKGVKDSLTPLSLVTKESIHCSSELKKFYDDAESVYMNKASSILCGESHVGLISKRAVKYTMISALSNQLTKKTDGSVSFSSCRAGYRVEDFKTTWKNTRRYLARLNHQDLKLVGFTDGLWGDDRKPLKWFKCQF